MSQHTPGQPCTCCILLRTGEPLESRHGEQPCSDISRIELCPKHAAAPAMYEALKAILDSEESTLGDGGSILGDDYRALVQAALAQAEGRPT